MTVQNISLLLSGPVVVILLAATLAITALLTAGFGRLPRLTTLGERAVENLSGRRFLLTGWGMAALLLTALLGGLLLNIKPLALLGLAVLLAGLTMTAFGLGVSAVRFGQSLAASLGADSSTPWQALKTGLAILFLATFLPFVGWLVVLLATAAGLGATLQALFRRDV